MGEDNHIDISMWNAFMTEKGVFFSNDVILQMIEDLKAELVDRTNDDQLELTI